MKLFEYAIILNPKGEKKEKAELLVAVKQVLASSEKNATVMASREIPKQYLDRLDDVEVVVRPF